jgi:hypothetical protein
MEPGGAHGVRFEHFLNPWVQLWLDAGLATSWEFAAIDATVGLSLDLFWQRRHLDREYSRALRR